MSMIEQAATTATTPPVIDANSCCGCGECCLHGGHPMYFKGSTTAPAETAWLQLTKLSSLTLNSATANRGTSTAGRW